MLCPVGGLRGISTSSIKPLLRPDPPVGTKVFLYDETFTFTWTCSHVPPTVLNEWRNRGDLIIDTFFERYGKQLENNEDVYQFIAKLNLDDEEHICNECCEDLCIIDFPKKIRERPPWFNKEQIHRDQ
jgi:hypothetical protein